VELPPQAASERYCRFGTQGRVTGRSHVSELWFVPAEGGVYLMSGSGGLTQWCLDLQAEQQGVVRIGAHSWLARGAFLEPDDPARLAALEVFHDRYDPPGKDRRVPWRRDARVAHLVFVRELSGARDPRRDAG
jgi:hypothetical protein